MQTRLAESFECLSTSRSTIDWRVNGVAKWRENMGFTAKSICHRKS